MRGRVAAAIACGALGLAAVSGWERGAHTPVAAALTNCDTSTGDWDAVELQVLSLVNAERADAGLAALLQSPGLARAAAWKSEDTQSAYGSGLSHTDSFGRGPATRVQDCGYPGQAAENIAYGFPTPESVVDAWMASVGHRANILKSIYVVAGVGHANGAWTIDFGLVNDSGAGGPVAPSPPPPAPPTATPTATASAPAPTPVPTPPPTPVPTAEPAPPESPLLPAAAAGVVQLKAGLNLVTFAGPQQPASAALTSLGNAGAEVSRWDLEGGYWHGWVRANDATFLMSPGEAYFIRVTGDAVWAY